MTIRTCLAGALSCSGAAAVSYAASRSAAFKGWNRTSYSGGQVSLVEGLAAACGLGLGALALPGRTRLGGSVVLASAAAAGAVDDHFEDRFPAQGKGLKGHLGALAQGKVTSGAVKIGLIGAGAALGALSLDRGGGALARTADWAGRSALIAGSANLVNLLDLRPGRALKASGLASASLLASSSVPSALSASVIGASAACLPSDLRGQTMLGDLGANAVGAALGLSLASLSSARTRWAALAGVVGLTLASEKFSFSEVIDRTPALAWIDRLGRA
ncbi:MAG: hypothetical protein Q3979_04130 [Actinomycetaceae bacterium]|nr:hypothetical protein [Actinomycetaceae bacterium]